MTGKFSNVEDRISTLMLESKMTQVKLSSITGLSTTAINSYCKGIRLPDTSSIFQISKALDTTIEWLLTGQGVKHPQATEDPPPSIWLLQDYQRQAAEEHYDNLTDEQVTLLDNYEKLTLPNRREMQGIIQLKLSSQMDSQLEGRTLSNTA